ncbi:MAG: hypothetical protein N3A61_04630, partial [Ignavibacteria bacterium]|nr:hypothetical protein [Ignavibacteria bacterium]
VFYVNSDSFKDIIALNSKNRQLTYFYNKSMLMFSESIIRKFDYRIDFVFNTNYNEDKFRDLILVSNEKREIYTLSGNGVGGFNFDKVHKFEYEISKPILSDFTKDNLPDIIFYNSSTSNLFLMCFDENNTLLPPIPILHISKKDNFSLYQTLKQIGIISTNGNDNLLLVLNSSLKLQRNNFSISSLPFNIKNFKSTKAPLDNLIWIDKFDNSLVILERDEFNSPEKIYRYKLKSDYDDFKINLEKNNKLSVLLFKKEYPHFQLLSIDFSNGTSTSQVISLAGEIYDVELQKNDEDQGVKIIVINKKSRGYFISMVDPVSINQVVFEENFADNHLIDFTSTLSTNGKVFYWHRKNDKIELIEKKFSDDFTTSKKSTLFTLTTNKNWDINIVSTDFRSDGNLDLVSAFSSSNQNYLFCLLSSEKGQFIEDLKLDNLKCTNKILMRQVVEDLNLSGRLVFYDENSKSLKSLISLRKGSKLITKTLKQINEINSFTLISFRRNLVELIYISKNLINLEII